MTLKLSWLKQQKSVTSLDQDPGVSLLGSSDSMSLMKLLSKWELGLWSHLRVWWGGWGWWSPVGFERFGSSHHGPPMGRAQEIGRDGPQDGGYSLESDALLHHHFLHILFIRSKRPLSAHLRGEVMAQGWHKSHFGGFQSEGLCVHWPKTAPSISLHICPDLTPLFPLFPAFSSGVCRIQSKSHQLEPSKSDKNLTRSRILMESKILLSSMYFLQRGEKETFSGEVWQRATQFGK